MSVNLTSLNGTIEEDVCNATWLAAVEMARCYEPDKVPAWNGCHDGQIWLPDQLEIMATRLEQTASIVEILRDLAKNGGVRIS